MKNNKPNLWVTGANGQVGQTFRCLSEKNIDFNFIFTNTNLLDLADQAAVRLFLEKNQIDFCINTMAYTAVDKAESESEKTFLLNTQIPSFLAEICKKFGVQFLHFSTDFVFDGQKNKAYSETDLPNPMSIYGKSKLEGEKQILDKNKNALIIRTAWVYSTYGNNFMKTMLRLAESRQELGVVSDQIGTPTFAQDLAESVLEMIKISQNKPLNGIFHYSNEGVASWYDFAYSIFRLANKKIQINPISTTQYPTPAQRPAFSVLDKTKIKTETGLKIPHWQESLEKVLKMV